MCLRHARYQFPWVKPGPPFVSADAAYVQGSDVDVRRVRTNQHTILHSGYISHEWRPSMFNVRPGGSARGRGTELDTNRMVKWDNRNMIRSGHKVKGSS